MPHLGRQSRTLIVLILGHASVDLAGGALFALLPFLVAERNYSLAAVGTFALVANVTNGIGQPLLGARGDLKDARWMLPVGLVLAGLGIAAAGLTTQFAATLAAVVVCMAGVAAYHPEGARLARATAGAGGLVEARMGLFSVGGGIGYVVAPLVVAAALATFGLGGAALVGALPLIAAVPLAIALRRIGPGGGGEAPRRTHDGRTTSEWRPFALLVAMFCLCSSIATGLIVYLPVYLVQARGTSPAASNVMTSILMGATTLGLALGGVVAQRYGRRLVLLAPELILAPAILLLPSLDYAAMIPVAIIAGLTMEANFSIVIVIGQEYLPGRMGLAAGLLNGFTTAVAGLVLYGLGLLGDAAGPAWALYALGLLPLGVVALTLLLPRPLAAPAGTRWRLQRPSR